MKFIAHTQDELKVLNLINGKSYRIQYLDKDYFNAEETVVKGLGVAMVNEDKIYFTITDDYGMDKLIINARILEN